MPSPVNGEPNLKQDDLLVVGCVRNEMLRLPWFLTHHRALGVQKFLLIDNGSDDGTRNFLLGQPDVCVFHTAERYSESRCGVSWLNSVLRDYAVGHWALVLDADELFIFPGFETLGLQQFVGYLETSGHDAVLAPMLDMYSRSPLAETGYRSGTSMLKTCPYFDGEGYEFYRPFPDRPKQLHRGGPRHRLFWKDHDRSFPSPVLGKIPLIKWKETYELEASTHILRGANTASTTGLLLHFKFLQDFIPNAHCEAQRKEHFRDARQYVAYDDVLTSTPGFSAFWEGSVRFEDSAQMLGLGFMSLSDDYPFPVK